MHQLLRSEFCKKSRRQQSSLWILGWFHSHLVFQSEFFNNSKKNSVRILEADGFGWRWRTGKAYKHWWKNNRWPRNYSGILQEFWTEIKLTSPYIVCRLDSGNSWQDKKKRWHRIGFRIRYQIHLLLGSYYTYWSYKCFDPYFLDQPVRIIGT